PTALVDREVELEAIHQRLVAEGARLLTLTGPAGVGKTRLALAAAAQLTDRFPDGVVLVDLTPIHEPQFVLCAAAHALALGDRPSNTWLGATLRERVTLLVLDNFDQVLPAAAQVAEVLEAYPGIALLVTSRVPLRLRWEWELRVAPLAVPDLSASLPSPEEL